MRVKEKHRRNVFFYSPGIYKSPKLTREEVNLSGPISTKRIIAETVSPHKDSSQPRRFQRWALPGVQRN